MRFIYTLFFYCLIPFILMRLLWRAIAAPAYAKRWGERFGFFPPLVTTKKVVWLHSVSVGEFIAALPLIGALQARGDLQLVITTTTPTGSERVTKSLGDSVFHVYAPYDLPTVLNRFLRRINPSLLLIMETELWPNTLAACKARQIPSVLINARMSEKSARGYQKFAFLTQPMLRNITKVLGQSSRDEARFISLGLSAVNSLVTGNIKFDLTISDELRNSAFELKREWSQDSEFLLWIAASTHPGEDEIILDAFAQCLQNPALQKLRLVLVPRHPERFNAVASLCVNRGFVVSRRSQLEIEASTQVVLGDTMGELLLMYGASDFALVGGSLVPNGGHNLIEPAAWSLPCISGPSTFNFTEVTDLLLAAKALQIVTSSNELAEAVENWSVHPLERSTAGRAALQVATENRGALARTINIIENYLK